jgi:hypothetical protein
VQFFTATCTFESWNSTAMNTTWQLQCRTWSNLLCFQHVQQTWSLAQKTEIGNLDQREYRNS